MSERILILDDEESILDIMVQLLAPQGYECHTEKSPLRAVERISHEDFALLLTDVRMPEMNGIEVVRQARAQSPELSIIVVTALMDVSNAIEAIRAGADDYILKPFNLRDITAAVTAALGKRQSVVESIEYQSELETRIQSAASDLERVNQELRGTKEYLENLLDSTVDAIVTVDGAGNIKYLNAGAKAMLGYTETEALGTPFANIVEGGADEFRYIERTLRAETRIRNYGAELRHKDGNLVPVNVSFSLVPDATGAVVSTLAICKDVTEQRRLEQELREMTVRDGLTGLYNQRYFHEWLEQETERARRQRRPLSLVLIDVDKFKTYNDSRGHLEGDRVLKTVGKIINETTREHVDRGFRFGGDEFCAVLPEATEEIAHSIAERIRGSFEAEGFEGLTLSVGVAQYNPESSVKAFIQYADELMYDAKRAGGNQVHTAVEGRSE